MTCPCPTHPCREVTDPAKHAAWHALVVEQGGPDGLCDLLALVEARRAAR